MLYVNEYAKKNKSLLDCNIIVFSPIKQNS